MTDSDDLLLARIDDAVAGKRVVVVGASRADVQDAFYAIMKHDNPHMESVVHATGKERIAFRGSGSICFVNARGHGGRGMSADVVLVRGWDDLSKEQRAEIAPIANHGQIIRA